MIQRILVPLDGSDLAEQVLPLVQELGTKLHAEVVLLQAVTPSTQIVQETVRDSMAVSAPELVVDVASQRFEAESAAAREYLAAVKERIAAPGLTVTTMVVEGTPEKVILDEAHSGDVSMIVMATHGRGGLLRVVYGSVADAVLRDAGVPVLLVRPKT